MRIQDPLKQWKLSPMDLERGVLWNPTPRRKRRCCSELTDRKRHGGSWLPSTSARHALNCIAHLLQQIPYEDVPKPSVQLPERTRHADYYRNPVPPEMYVPDRYR